MTPRGARGPIAGTVHKLPAARRPTVSEVAEPRQVPRAPKGLEAPGKAAWAAVMSWTPMLLPGLDGVSVQRFCQLVDERATVAAELVRGPVLERPIVSPRGDVVGTELYATRQRRCCASWTRRWTLWPTVWASSQARDRVWGCR